MNGKIKRGQQYKIGPMRIVIGSVHDDKADVHVVFDDRVTLGHGATCPVDVIEDFVTWYEKLPIGQIEA